MNRVAEHGDGPLGPTLQHRWPAVVEVPLLDDAFRSVAQAGVDLVRPASELLPQELQVRRSCLGVRWQRQECVPGKVRIDGKIKMLNNDSTSPTNCPE